MNDTPRRPWLWTTVFAIIAVAYLYPIYLVVINSFKGKVFISSEPFSLPNAETFVGWENYIRGIELTDFLWSFVWSLVITLGSAFVILLFTSMAAWWIVRMDNRYAKSLYVTFIFNLVVPFQMVMFTLSWLADYLGLTTPWGLWVIYLGFGAGLAVFIFTGFVKGIPYEIEEAATIDGCGPVRTFFLVVMPIMKPAVVTVAILEVMWLWNDYLLPYLTLDLKSYKTIPIAVQYLRGGYGSIDIGAMMGVLVLAMIPVIVFYLFSQKQIIRGVVAGAVKG
ncbi:carbohydrate ABC transporter permease [Microbacterium thalassium]|uniref:Raffinose/stachyose/melibiose transport system permease protein n=1 Tax=Microbacterium thalassium TaxID=362649 RepID=A0A7X0KV13_9MICO|nr:carbohydrate ABC transporter permease [Microbacterium thalassium]MBB6391609.1 raffinose/stachyose/melibiose transport system permease protein [Microbacterium thalassium]GLK24212.1 sugar ABC transporter permease [Microbacterium thalassium]